MASYRGGLGAPYSKSHGITNRLRPCKEPRSSCCFFCFSFGPAMTAPPATAQWNDRRERQGKLPRRRRAIACSHCICATYSAPSTALKSRSSRLRLRRDARDASTQQYSMVCAVRCRRRYQERSNARTTCFTQRIVSIGVSSPSGMRHWQMEGQPPPSCQFTTSSHLPPLPLFTFCPCQAHHSKSGA